MQRLHKIDTMPTKKRSFKRPFQASVSSYFGKPTHDSDIMPVAQMSTSSSAIPTIIQFSLLDVGMRVRKSISQGYQTQPKMSSGLPDAYHHVGPERNRVTPSRGFTGLVPHCGILNIGGHSIQSTSSQEGLPPLQFDGDEWAFLSSQRLEASCESFEPVVTVPVVSSHKRRREDDDDEFDMESQPVSPRSYSPFSHTRMPNLDQSRPIALPKTRKKAVLEPLGSEESEMIGIEDFGEAEFFRPDEWGDWGHADET